MEGKRKGFFLSFEGIDGSGKSVQAERLYRQLKELKFAVVFFREPGGTEISERIRDILLDSQHQGMSAPTELFLYLAARSQLIEEKIFPELNRNRIVVTDRFSDSTIAYQAFGRKLPILGVAEANRQACRGLKPNRTYLLDVPVGESRKRMLGAGKSDRMEMEKEVFFERVRNGYLEIAKQETERILVLDGLKSVDALAQEIQNDAISQLKNHSICQIERGCHDEVGE